VGGGVVRANGFKALQQLAKLFTTSNDHFNGKSSYNEKDHLSLGMLECMGQLMPIMLLVNVIYNCSWCTI
jgi:thiamine pyrophosphate-dependent acetolactate synthase large subunit-like protein